MSLLLLCSQSKQQHFNLFHTDTSACKFVLSKTKVKDVYLDIRPTMFCNIGFYIFMNLINLVSSDFATAFAILRKSPSAYQSFNIYAENGQHLQATTKVCGDVATFELSRGIFLNFLKTASSPKIIPTIILPSASVELSLCSLIQRYAKKHYIHSRYEKNICYAYSGGHGDCGHGSDQSVF